jgi:hypothetical protein
MASFRESSLSSSANPLRALSATMDGDGGIDYT